MQNISNAAMLAEPSIVSRGFENSHSESERIFALDTTFVLFFLALELGQSWLSFGLDGLLAAVTLGMFVAIPYFLPFTDEKRDFGSWVLGRTLVAAAGLSLGFMLKQSIGVLLPETFRYVPMTLLIVAAIVSCYVQVYGMIKYRLAR